MESIPRAKFRVYWATQPPPVEVSQERLHRLIPVDFSTESDAIYAAALLLRAKNHVWCIECPDGSTMEAVEVNARCAPLLRMFNSQLHGSQ
jgi:hypothetical protein